MFDNLRQQAAGGSPFVPGDEEDEEVLEEVQEAPVSPLAPSRGFMGLTAGQRFVLALMLLLNVVVLGCFCLLATETIVPFQ